MKKILSVILLLFVSWVLLGSSVGSNQLSSNQSTSGDESSLQNNDNFMNLSSQSLGINGPLSFGVQYSKAYGAFVSGKYIQRFNLTNAVALGAEMGSKQRRVDVTWAHLLTDHQRFKLSAEYLTQKLDFDFLSGNVDRFVGQTAYGATYEYLLPSQLFRYFDINAYYADAQSKDLSAKNFYDSTEWYENLRRIAGAKTTGGSLGVTLTPSRSNLVGFALDYDKVSYHTKYIQGQNRSGLGGSIDFEQLLTPRVKLSLLASDRKTYDTYQAGLDWLAITAPLYNLTFNVSGSRIIGLGQAPNDTLFGVNFVYHWDQDKTGQVSQISLTPYEQQADISNWVAQPSVYMQQVMAIKDETKIQLPSTSSDSVHQTANQKTPYPRTDQHPQDETYSVNTKITDVTYQALDLFKDPQSLFNTLTLSMTGLEGSGLSATFTPDPTKADNGTIVLSGTTAKEPGVYHVQIHAANLYGESSETQDFTITINGISKPTVHVNQKPPYKIGQTSTDEDIADIDAVSGTLEHTIKVANQDSWTGHGLQATVKYSPDSKTAQILMNGKTTDPTYTEESLSITGVKNSDGQVPDGSYAFALDVVSPPVWQQDINSQPVVVTQGDSITPVNLGEDGLYFRNPSPNITGAMSFAIKNSPDTGLSIQGNTLQGTVTAEPGTYVVQVFAHNSEGDSVGSDYKTLKATLYHLQVNAPPTVGYLLCPEGSSFVISGGKATVDTKDSLGYSYHFESVSDQYVDDSDQLTDLAYARYSSNEKFFQCAYHTKLTGGVSTVSYHVPAVEASDIKFTYYPSLDMCVDSREKCQLQYTTSG